MLTNTTRSFAPQLATAYIIDILCRSAAEHEQAVAKTRERLGQVSPTDEAMLLMMWEDLQRFTVADA